MASFLKDFRSLLEVSTNREDYGIWNISSFHFCSPSFQVMPSGPSVHKNCKGVHVRTNMTGWFFFLLLGLFLFIYFIFGVLFCFLFFKTGFSIECPGNHSVDQIGLKLQKTTCLCCSRILGLKACAACQAMIGHQSIGERLPVLFKILGLLLACVKETEKQRQVLTDSKSRLGKGFFFFLAIYPRTLLFNGT